jgi:hypothetical protein
MENRKIVIGFKSTKEIKEFLHQTARRFYFNNTSLAAHEILRFAKSESKSFEKWIEAERKKSADQSLV